MRTMQKILPDQGTRYELNAFNETLVKNDKFILIVYSSKIFFEMAFC